MYNYLYMFVYQNVFLVSSGLLMEASTDGKQVSATKFKRLKPARLSFQTPQNKGESHSLIFLNL